jgi:hypothetical protein
LNTASERWIFKTNAEIPAAEEFNLTSEIFDQTSEGMPKEEFKN